MSFNEKSFECYLICSMCDINFKDFQWAKNVDLSFISIYFYDLKSHAIDVFKSTILLYY